MASIKLHYINNYRFLIKLLALMILCFFLVSCNKKEPQTGLTVKTTFTTAANAVDLNTATAEELEKLPHVGAKTAQRIVAHRARYGRFRKPEHLILVQGISDRRFRQLQSLVKTE